MARACKPNPHAITSVSDSCSSLISSIRRLRPNITKSVIIIRLYPPPPIIPRINLPKLTSPLFFGKILHKPPLFKQLGFIHGVEKVGCDESHQLFLLAYNSRGHFYLRFALILITPSLRDCEYLPAYKVVYDAHAGLW